MLNTLPDTSRSDSMMTDSSVTPISTNRTPLAWFRDMNSLAPLMATNFAAQYTRLSTVAVIEREPKATRDP